MVPSVKTIDGCSQGNIPIKTILHHHNRVILDVYWFQEVVFLTLIRLEFLKAFFSASQFDPPLIVQGELI